MERSSSVATWEFMKESGSSDEEDVGSPEDEEEELLSLSLKRKGLRLPTSKTSPKRQRTAGVPSGIPAETASLNGTNQASARFLNAKSHRPGVSEPGPSRPSPFSTGTSLGTSSRKEPSEVLRSSQIPATPSFLGSPKFPQPTRVSKPGGQVKGKERSVNTGLPVPRSRSSAGPTKISSKLKSEVIELSDNTDIDMPPAQSVAKAHYVDTGPPSTIRTPNRLPSLNPKRSAERTEVITIDESDEETSSASNPKPAPKATSKESAGLSSLSSATNYQSAPISSTQKLAADIKPPLPTKRTPTMTTPHSGRVDNLVKMKVEGNAKSAPNGRRCVNRSDVRTPVAAEPSPRKPTPAVPLLDLRSPRPGRNDSCVSGPSGINTSKSPSVDTREPKSTVLLTKPSSQVKPLSAAPRRLSGLDMSGLKDVLTDAVSLSSLRLPQPLESEKPSSLPAPSSGRDLRPTLHSPEANAAIQHSDNKGKEKERLVSSNPKAKVKTSAHTSSRPSGGASECIDLTLDSDSDASPPPPPVPRPLPLPRPPYLASAIKSSELLKEILTKPEPPTSPPLPKAKSRSTESDIAPPKTSSSSTPARNNTPIRPMPLPIPRPRLPSQELKKSPSVSMSAGQDTQPTKFLQRNSQSPISLTRSPIEDTAYTSDSIGNGSGHTSASASSSIEASPVVTPLPPRTARKSTRGRFSNQRLLSSIGARSSISASTPPREPVSSSSRSLAPVKLFNKPTQVSKLTEIATEVVVRASSITKKSEEPMDIPSRESSPPTTGVGTLHEHISTEPTAKPTSVFDNDSELEYVDDTEDKTLPPLFIVGEGDIAEGLMEADSTEMMDVEELLTALRKDSPLPLPHETTPDWLDRVSAEEDLQPRRSTRSSRSASGEPMKLFLDDGFADSSSSSPRASPTPPEDFSVLAPVKTFGGFKSLNWRTYRQDPENMRIKCYFGKDLPHTLQDTINSFSEAGRRHRSLRAVMEAAIRENTAEDEPDAPLIEIINEVDDDPTPPWEFHYSNKIWFGEDVPLPDLTKLVHCNCIGRCDPKTKPCACAERQRGWVDGMFHSPDFLYDSKGHVKATDYPVFECNDLCGCSDECRNRVVQHGRKCAIRIQKTAEKGWGVFAGAKKISAGSFIGVYAGELLTDRVGEIRGITYNKFGRTYLFDLDFWHLKEGNEDWDIQYTVDAYHAGNFTRFLNHSCDPNCSLVSCYINDSDLQKPLLTVFAKRDIEPFEELCFSYSGDDGSDDNDGEASRSSPAGDKDAVYVKCACKAWNCTGYMFK